MKFKAIVVLNIIKRIGTFYCLWPLDPVTKLSLRLLHEVKRAIFIINGAMYIIPLILSAYHNIYDKPQAAIEALGNSGSHIDDLLNLILWGIQQNQFQIILTEITNHAIEVKGENEIILNNYFSHHFTYGIYTSITCILTSICYILSPLYSPQVLPDAAWYPFEIKVFTWRYYIIYLLQTLGIAQNVLGVSIHIAMTIILFLDIPVKLRILSLEIEKVRNENEVIECIEEHQKIIGSAKKLDHVMRFIVLKSYITVCIAVIFAAIQVFFSHSLLNMIGAIFYVTACLLAVFLYTWAADDMNKASTNVAWALYNSNWTEFAPKTRKYIVIMMCRAQKSLDISVNGILPSLTIHFYGRFIIFIISYFMALRTLIIK